MGTVLLPATKNSINAGKRTVPMPALEWSLSMKIKPDFKRTEAEFLMVLVAMIWGVTFVLVKDALADIGPFLFLGIRFILAFFVLAIFSFNNLKKIEVSTLMSGCLLGFFLFIGY